jgi:hypothetical protein
MMALVKRDENGDLPESKEQLVMFYHGEFVKALKQFGYMKAPPSLLDLNVELLKQGAIGVIFDVIFMPFQIIDFSQISIDDLIFKDGTDRGYQFRLKMYRDPTCQKIIKQGLKTWITKGIL